MVDRRDHRLRRTRRHRLPPSQPPLRPRDGARGLDGHDAYFRHVLSRPADAASELRSALPEAVAARVDWGRLELQPGSFVSKHLRSRYVFA
ncbi:Rpn family recombination-promoting nuclease/putative transposase [Nocardia sp. NPDC004654]|uniref:Rpn family recombination-promoting nuclease/putative transposase n=1 Tax=Nocardia sp. NPDC004654 TaxID=3154776 RepID=UPI0033B435A2